MKKRKKILIVENNDTLRELLRVTLRTRGYLVETAHDGRSGLEKLEEDSYDLLITDNQMPRMDGLELIEEIYRRKMGLRILMISGRFTKDILERVKERGVLECLDKPFSFKQMIETVREILEKDTINEEKVDSNQHSKQLEADAL